MTYSNPPMFRGNVVWTPESGWHDGPSTIDTAAEAYVTARHAEEDCTGSVLDTDRAHGLLVALCGYDNAVADAAADAAEERRRLDR